MIKMALSISREKIDYTISGFEMIVQPHEKRMWYLYFSPYTKIHMNQLC